MKKVGAFLIGSIIIVISLFLINGYLQGQIHKKYYDKMGDIIDYRKYQGIVMQKEATKRNTTLFIFGSSEVGGTKSKDPFHPSNFFANEKGGFQVELVGRAYCQSLIHTLNIGALGNSLKGKKVVLIVSPQWFDKKGLSLNHLKVNFSEEQFYAFMFNKSISLDLKKRVASRIINIIGNSGEMNEVKELCSLTLTTNPLYMVKLFAETPYFKGRSFLLQLRDKIQALTLIDNSNKALLFNEHPHYYTFNWEKELNLFNYVRINNPYDFDNYLYSNVYSKEIKLMKKYTHHIALNDSPEFEDLGILLDTFKEVGIEPLIIDLPMNGSWYDYCGIGRVERAKYYTKINKIVNAYQFQLIDMSGYEYEAHAFKDSSHLEWKGLVYVDEAIDKYFHENNNHSKK